MCLFAWLFVCLFLCLIVCVFVCFLACLHACLFDDSFVVARACAYSTFGGCASRVVYMQVLTERIGLGRLTWFLIGFVSITRKACARNS